MLILVLVLFGLAAVLGISVAIPILKKTPTSKSVAVIHGLLGAAGLILLIVAAARQPHAWLRWAVGLLIVAALGGLILFANDLRKKPGPVGLVVVHALVAVAAVVLVLLVAVQ